jgi:hypothetical protein
MRSGSVARLGSVLVLVAMVLATPGVPAGATDGGDTLVSVGSAGTLFSQNKQNEPAVAIDPAHSEVVAAGANDNIDMEECSAGPNTDCPFTEGVGVSGIYFSFDSGDTWTQPTYEGFTARDCTGDATCEPHEGPIGTLPGYYENGLVSDGDPALAFGPVPGADGSFSWSNGSRLYYANLTANFSASDAAFRGPEAIYVSRTDDPQAAAAGSEDAWYEPRLVTKQSATTFSDKEQIWADNAESSPYFGNVYLCLASFRSNSNGYAAPQPLLVATSRDGGDTWTVKQVTSASNNPFNTRQGFGRSGCTVRTDADGVVYVMANQFAVGSPGNGSHILIRSFNGGKNWTRPTVVQRAVDTCFLVQFDGIGFRCVEDGLAGARDDLSSSPSLAIANGAPDGTDAPDDPVLYKTWVDGRDGPNVVHVYVSWSTNGGLDWHAPVDVVRAGDRGYYSAIAVSPDGSDLYLVYNAFTTGMPDDTTSPRGLVAEVLHADVGPNGEPTGWAELHRTPVGDPRASAQNNLVLEFLGDYVYAAATNDYGVAVWNDARDGDPCDAINGWRADVQESLDPTQTVDVEAACPTSFGDTSIYGGSYADPTP